MSSPVNRNAPLRGEPELRSMLYAGLAVQRDAVERLLRRGGALAPPLCAFVTAAEAWADRSPRGVWAPIHAIHLLGALHDPRATPAFAWVLRTRDLGDWVTEAMPSILAALPPAALGTLADLAGDSALGPFHRVAAVWGMVGVAAHHPSARTRVATDLARLAAGCGDPTFGASLLDAVVASGDPVARAAIREAARRGMVDPTIADLGPLDAANEAARPWELPTEIHDPLDYFAPARLEALRQVARARRGSGASPTAAWAERASAPSVPPVPR